MKKWIFLGIFLFLAATAEIAIADQHLWGKWKGENSERSVIYNFEPKGQGSLDVTYRSSPNLNQEQVILHFFYVIERRVIASSEIDSFREYLVNVWIPSSNLTGTIRILFRKDGKIDLSEENGENKLTLVRITDRIL